MTVLSVNRLAKALESLKNGYKPHPSDLERDGLTQRFEYTLQLCWKTAKKVLFINGIEVDTPKNVMRELGALGWIDNPEDWLDYIEKRNQTGHMYNEAVAEEIFSVIAKFIIDAEKLLKTLSANNK